MKSFTLPLVSARHLHRALATIHQDDDRRSFHTVGRCPSCGHILKQTRVLGYDGYEKVLICDNQNCDAYNEIIY